MRDETVGWTSVIITERVGSKSAASKTTIFRALDFAQLQAAVREIMVFKIRLCKSSPLLINPWLQ